VKPPSGFQVAFYQGKRVLTRYAEGKGHDMKLQFTDTARLLDYASSRAGDDDQRFAEKSQAEQAWTTVAGLAHTSTLPQVKEALERLAPIAKSATREKIYRFVAERIVC